LGRKMGFATLYPSYELSEKTPWGKDTIGEVIITWCGDGMELLPMSSGDTRLVDWTDIAYLMRPYV